MNENIWAEIDMSNQIDNTWNKDSCLALIKGYIKHTIKIKSEDKKVLKKKFIWNDEQEQNRKHNRRVIVVIYCYMLYKLLQTLPERADKIKLCNDAGPKWAVNKYLSAIYRYFGKPPLTEAIRLKFRRAGEPGSAAHNLARKVMKGRQKENYLISKQDIDELEDILRKII